MRIFHLQLTLIFIYQVACGQKQSLRDIEAAIVGSWTAIEPGNLSTDLSSQILSFFPDHTYQRQNIGFYDFGIPANSVDSVIVEGGKWEVDADSRILNFRLRHTIPNDSSIFKQDLKGKILVTADSSLTIKYDKWWPITEYRRTTTIQRKQDNYSPKKVNRQNLYFVNRNDKNKKVEIAVESNPFFDVTVDMQIFDSLIASSIKEMSVQMEMSTDTSMICIVYSEVLKIKNKDGTSSEMKNDYFAPYPGQYRYGYSTVKRTLLFKDIRSIVYQIGWRRKKYSLKSKTDAADKDLWFLHKPIE